VLTNLAGADADSIADGVAGLYEPGLVPLERTAVQIDPKTSDKYLGEYDIAPGFVLTVSREGDRLWMQATGQKRAELFAESETSFFLKEADVQLTFVKDASGKITHVLLRQGGFDIEAKKIR
jgi:D-alanyl-D-alanine-carboxypeptidase/D-alanyl-D-alanine-endopeptidase